jgi:hypothetical protein
MAGFLTDFLHADFAQLGRKDPPRVHLAAFGKHPGWNDHVEDIALDSPALIAAKRYLYLQGLSGQIDANAWEKLPPEHKLPGYDHWLLWHRPGECLLGRLWSSADGKGRTRYPMVLLAHYIGLPAAWALVDGMPALEDAAARCRTAATAPEVLRIVADATTTLRNRAHRAAAAEAPARDILAAAASHPLGETELLRVFHVVVNQLAAFAPGTVDTKDPAAAKGRHFRLPRVGQAPEESLAYWVAFFLTQLDGSVPTLVLLPHAEPWADVIVAEPSSADFYGLRANAAALPLATDVPYQISEGLRDAVAALYDGPISGALPARGIFSRKPAGAAVHALLTTRDGLWQTAGGGLFKKIRGILGG